MSVAILSFHCCFFAETRVPFHWRLLFYPFKSDCFEVGLSYSSSDYLLTRSLARSLARSLGLPQSIEKLSLLSLVCLILYREKLYFIEVLHQRSPEENAEYAAKTASRCGIPRTRMKSYKIQDFIRMSTATSAELVGNLRSLQSKQYRIHLVNFKRREPSVFSKKRYLHPSGDSSPFHYHAINALEQG